MKKIFFVLYLITSLWVCGLDIDSIFTRKKENFTNDWLGKQTLSIDAEDSSYGDYIFYNSTKNIIAVIDGYNIVIRNAISLELIKTLVGENSYVDSLAFSNDGKYLASGNRDKTVNIWDIETGKIIKTLIGHSSYSNYQAIKSVGSVAKN